MQNSKSWLTFLESVKAAKTKIGADKIKECFYRGHTHDNHKLLPGLFREMPNKRKQAFDFLWEAEYAMFYEFRSRAKEIHWTGLSDWDILFYMQHHGCKTRLLDWTENFGVALYFALLGENMEGFSPTIWLLNARALNLSYRGNSELLCPEYLDDKNKSYQHILVNNFKFWWDVPISLYPVRRADRLTTQGGYFTIHGNDTRAIEEQIPESERIWTRIELPLEAVPDAKDYLKMSGINDFSIFPDLDGLSRYLNKKHL